jgi:N-acetylmuramoyl-L-alanine amidase
MGNKKIIVAVGHTKSGTNGSGVSGYLDESNCNREIVPLVVNILNSIEGYEAKELRIDKGNSYQFEDCYTRCQLSNEWGADLYVEIHLNGFSTPSARGTEVLVNSENSNAIAYAKRINANLCNTLGTSDRTYGKGYKTQNLIVLQKTHAPALLIECLFATNESDSSKYNASTIANCIAEGLTNQTINVTSKPYIAKPMSSQSGGSVSPTQSVVSGTIGTVTASTLNVRNTPSGTIIGQLSNGTKVKINRIEGDWVSIFFGDHGGWISKNYVSIGTNVVQAPTPTVASIDGSYATVTANTLNVRDGIMGNIIGKLSKGDKVKLYKKESNWYHIYYGNSGAYISADYIKL